MTASPRTRFLWQAGGLLSLGLGIIGIPLPLLPTTPFILLAAFCFARSSPQLQRWLETHPRFGPMIVNWREKGAISKRAKIYSVAVMIATPLLSLAIGVPMWALAAQVLCLLGAATFVLTRPSV
jgi:uncharacterized membrane protein YbaN (DUF454 family)